MTSKRTIFLGKLDFDAVTQWAQCALTGWGYQHASDELQTPRMEMT